MFKKLLATGIIASLVPSLSLAALYLSPTVSYQSTTSDTIKYQGIGPKLAFGIDNDASSSRVPNSAYYALEMFAMPLKPINIHGDATDTTLRPRWSYGLSFTPGVNLDGIIKTFTILGVTRTAFTTPSHVETGYQIGVGAEFKFSQYWAIRLKYLQTSYKSFSGLSSPKTEEGQVSFVYRLA